MGRSPLLLAALCVSLSGAVSASDTLPGGKATVIQSGPNAYSMPSANLSMMERLDFNVGNSFFRNPWVTAPASTDARDGLGPLFNTNSCQSCHIKDGRGHPPNGPEDNAVSMLVRLGIPANTPEQRQQQRLHGNVPEPVYGSQFQDGAIPGVAAEGRVQMHWVDVPVTFADGETLTLRKPRLTLVDLQYGPMDPAVKQSARVAPAMIGLGLLEALPDAAILADEDPDDSNGDGISGKANRVWDVTNQTEAIGRFGWKAGQPTLMQQNAAAFNGDLGLTSRLFPRDHCSNAQQHCRQAPHGGQPEVNDEIMEAVLFYTRHLAVPARQVKNAQQVQAGKALFHQAGCHQCHRPSYTLTTADGETDTFWPYTDLLLHDMGEGLADGLTEFQANGREWRTPPLWGLSHLEAVNGHTFLLHDGRARNVLEAILWHGGEAEAAKKAVLNMNKADRQALVTFVESL